MERKISAVITSGDGQLAIQGLFVHTNTHGGNLQRMAQSFIAAGRILWAAVSISNI